MVAAERAPHEGLGRSLAMVLDIGRLAEEFEKSPIGKCAVPAILSLAGWLETVFADDVQETEVLSAAAVLVGLGPGLTPSGDDFLGGILIALSEFGEPVIQQDLAGWSMSLAAARTGKISRAHLACACVGEGSRALHTLLATVLAGDIGSIERGIREIDGIGHCSGWDALAGAAFACACWHRACGMKQGAVQCR